MYSPPAFTPVLTFRPAVVLCWEPGPPAFTLDSTFSPAAALWLAPSIPPAFTLVLTFSPAAALWLLLESPPALMLVFTCMIASRFGAIAPFLGSPPATIAAGRPDTGVIPESPATLPPIPILFRDAVPRLVT